MANKQNIPNYLVQSILVLLCCCQPLGIVALVFAAQVDGKANSGDIAGAQDASSKASTFCMIGFIGGLIVNGLALLMYFLVVAGSIR